jgi:hypothetical protein
MKHIKHCITFSFFFILLTGFSTAFAADFIIKYYIFPMDTEQDRSTIVDFIYSHEGVQKVETVLDRHWVYIYLEDDVLDDERFDLRVPLRDMGYPVNRWEVLLEKPDSHD